MEKIKELCLTKIKTPSIQVPQRKDCKIAVLVPVFNEDVSTLSRLLSSLASQQEIENTLFEVVLIVNNDVPGTASHSAAFDANQKVLSTNWAKELKSNLHIYALDCSSKGKEIENCSVGAARDRGSHEAAFRFAQNDNNGILLHVDADVCYEDGHFLHKVLSIFSDSDVIGAAGGKQRRAILSDYPQETYPDRQKLIRAIHQQGMAGRCKYLITFIKGEEPIYRVFGGSNMMSRAYETVLIGGIPHINYLEDFKFGYALWDYAVAHSKRVIIDRSLQVVSAFRLSERTGSSFENSLRHLMNGKVPVAKHPINHKEILLDEAAYQDLRSIALTLPHSKDFVAYLDTYDIEVQP